MVYSRGLQKTHKCKPNAKNVPVDLNLRYFKTNLVFLRYIAQSSVYLVIRVSCV